MAGGYTASMSRAQAIAAAERYFDEGRLFDDLARRVALPTESQNPERAATLAEYLESELAESLERMGFACRIVPNPVGAHGPFLIAERIEAEGLPTVLSYGHGDVIRGQEGEWRAGLMTGLFWDLGESDPRSFAREKI
jgi:acetylornithine deacetylase/succinyl-diaminopimelate desuccinylase-like protein